MSKGINAKRFSKVLRAMAQAPSKATTAIARDINIEIQRGFDRGEDPYGKKWRGLADSTIEAGRHNPPLTDTGRGRASVVVSPTVNAGLKLTIGVLYMIYHQFGGPSHLRGPGGSYRLRKKNKDFGRDKDRSGGRENPPKRSFVPFDRMPRTWGEIILARIEEAAGKALRRGA